MCSAPTRSARKWGGLPRWARSASSRTGRGCGNRITLLDQQYVYRDCHPGAVYEFTDRRLFRVTGSG